MTNTGQTTIAQDAERFAGLDSERVFTDLAAGRFVSGYDVIAAAEQVARLHPELSDALNALTARVKSAHYFWD
ncbi:hypothetical protein ACT17_14955 [Mycolicibacterium conceptionense]|uniref:Uncharacterized protein n=1 Tax=Mycolicibacterium conceptionense TaxID=451644 RepID=A0A0J8U9A1_9MYCO|nr:hypothetical protein [Mycolicibacterium conceptionense]KMV17587.1 hypothetical protein ACT17_14955 [Mycolicibacterium conceptionense]